MVLVRRGAKLRSVTAVLLASASLLLASCGVDGSGTTGAPTSTEGPTSTTGQERTSSSSTPPPSTTTTEPPPTTSTTSTVADRPGPDGDRPSRVVVDPGHNGRNFEHTAEIGRTVDAGGFTKACNTTGTANASMTESMLNWLVATELRTVLETDGVEVVLTRQDDDGWGPCIDERGLTALRSDADLLVSIHADGAPASAHGFHVIHPAPGPTVDEATAARSEDLAGRIRDALVGAGFEPSTYAGVDGLVERGDLGTLNRAGVPAVMVECGNMHHPGDAELLGSTEGRRRIAEAIGDALVALDG